MRAIRIVLIGAGQLGSRHLQALASLERPASIQVIDPSRASLEIAQQRWEEVNGHDEIEFLFGFKDGVAAADVAIVATNADVRRDVVESMLGSIRPAHVILEKVVFQHPDDFVYVAPLFEYEGLQAWVNCPRRMWPTYQELKSKVKTPIHFEVAGSNWGLACNAIHFLDLFAFLAGTKEVSIEPQLDLGRIESKRPGFVEVTGSLRADFGGAGKAVLTSDAEGEKPVVIKLEDDFHRWELEEGKGKLTVARKPDGKKAEQNLEVLYQSNLTHIVVNQLIQSGECGLTPYEESWALHVPLLKVISEHLYGPGEVMICPIT